MATASIHWTHRPAPGPADAAYAALKIAARRSAFREIKLGARRYALAPSLLDALEAGLSRLPPKAMSRRLNYLWAEEIEMPRGGWIGGLMPKITLRSAMVYARYSARVERAKFKGFAR